MPDDLPRGISEILKYLAMKAQGYDNRLQWHEVHKLKADLMNAGARWRSVPVSQVAARCQALGMRAEDVATITDLITRAQAGRRLVPNKTYRTYQFNQPIDS